MGKHDKQIEALEKEVRENNEMIDDHETGRLRLLGKDGEEFIEGRKSRNSRWRQLLGFLKKDND